MCSIAVLLGTELLLRPRPEAREGSTGSDATEAELRRLHGLGRHENGAEQVSSSTAVAPSEEETVASFAALVTRTVQ